MRKFVPEEQEGFSLVTGKMEKNWDMTRQSRRSLQHWQRRPTGSREEVFYAASSSTSDVLRDSQESSPGRLRPSVLLRGRSHFMSGRCSAARFHLREVQRVRAVKTEIVRYYRNSSVWVGVSSAAGKRTERFQRNLLDIEILQITACIPRFYLRAAISDCLLIGFIRATETLKKELKKAIRDWN